MARKIRISNVDGRWVTSRNGSLQSRIAAGKAEPISDRERDQLEALRQTYIQKFGVDPSAHKASKTA